jgi:bromodomain and PHD finger-containing protein 1
MYFPNCSKEFKDKVESVHEVFKKFLDKLVNAKSVVKKGSMPNTKKNLIVDLASSINHDAVLESTDGLYKIDSSSNLKKTQIDAIVSKLTNMLNSISSGNKNAFEQLNQNLRDNFIEYISTEDEYSYDPDDILNDMTYKSESIKKFKEYIITTHEENASKNILTCRTEEENLCNPDDIVCLVCNDGDYEDNNLIVYCSSCQMTVHQLCYGIMDIPNEDWNCHSCQAFGFEKSKAIECILCSVKGGAMKPSLLKKNSSYYNSAYKLRNKKNNKPDNDDVVMQDLSKMRLDKKIIKNIIKNIFRGNIEIVQRKVISDEMKHESNKKGKEKKKEILDNSVEKNCLTINYKHAKENAWVHLSCACWIPEVEIAKFDNKEDIKSK